MRFTSAAVGSRESSADDGATGDNDAGWYMIEAALQFGASNKASWGSTPRANPQTTRTKADERSEMGNSDHEMGFRALESQLRRLINTANVTLLGPQIALQPPLKYILRPPKKLPQHAVAFCAALNKSRGQSYWRLVARSLVTISVTPRPTAEHQS